jgi:hypothetical protein
MVFGYFGDEIIHNVFESRIKAISKLRCNNAIPTFDPFIEVMEGIEIIE